MGATAFLVTALSATVFFEWPRPDVGAPGAPLTPWTEVGAKLQRRAAVELRDDFRHGLQEWTSRSRTPPGWSFDNLGFVHPGTLALYRPTLELRDYLLEFDAQVDRQAIGFVFRASDLDNYYAVKLVIAQPGPLPKGQVVRYAVIDGHEGPHTVSRLPLTVRGETTYRVRMEVQGHDFTLITQGKVADQWSDARLARGGVGFFCAKGDQARLRRVGVSYQNDTLGKLCAYIAPSRRTN